MTLDLARETTPAARSITSTGQRNGNRFIVITNPGNSEGGTAFAGTYDDFLNALEETR